MRENRPHGSEGGEAKAFPTPITHPVFKGPDRRPVRDVQRLRQSAEALIAEPIPQKEFHSLIRQTIQSLQHQHAHPGLRRIRRSATLGAQVSRGRLIQRSGQHLEINTSRNACQRITQMIDLPYPQLRRQRGRF